MRVSALIIQPKTSSSFRGRETKEERFCGVGYFLVPFSRSRDQSDSFFVSVGEKCTRHYRSTSYFPTDIDGYCTCTPLVHLRRHVFCHTFQDATRSDVQFTCRGEVQEDVWFSYTAAQSGWVMILSYPSPSIDIRKYLKNNCFCLVESFLLLARGGE